MGRVTNLRSASKLARLSAFWSCWPTTPLSTFEALLIKARLGIPDRTRLPLPQACALVAPGGFCDQVVTEAVIEDLAARMRLICSVTTPLRILMIFVSGCRRRI
jgi:hypothetical protein